jgi:hypothetical protein
MNMKQQRMGAFLQVRANLRAIERQMIKTKNSIVHHIAGAKPSQASK